MNTPVLKTGTIPASGLRQCRSGGLISTPHLKDRTPLVLRLYDVWHSASVGAAASIGGSAAVNPVLVPRAIPKWDIIKLGFSGTHTRFEEHDGSEGGCETYK